ncbi:MAG: hypothetical protein ACKVWR_21890 [Acidimicrobiales bacterium]
MASKTSGDPKRIGLLLDMPGAPNVWHGVSDLPFTLHPTEPRWLDDTPMWDEQRAKDWIKAHQPAPGVDATCPMRLTTDDNPAQQPVKGE